MMILMRKYISVIIIGLMLSMCFSAMPVSSDINQMNSDINSIEPESGLLLYTDWTGSYILNATQSAESFNVYCHIPVVFDDQSPLIFGNVWSEPSGRINGFSIAHNYTGSNALLNISINSMNEGELIKIFWNITSLNKINDYSDLPKYIKRAPKYKLPEDVKKWLLPTDYIQSNNIRIKLVALFLRLFNNNVNKIAKRITNFTSNKIEYDGRGQDALTVLKNRRGVCTGKANLAAALLRANGIPARILMIYPTHYVIEYYAHPYGWVRSDATAEIIPCSTYRTVAFCAYPEDETSSHIVNNNSPIHGVIAYWGTSNYSKVKKHVNYLNFSLKATKHLITSEQKADESIALGQESWSYYSKYLGMNLSSSQKEKFQNGINYEKAAIYCFEGNNTDGYIENMQLAISEYKKIDN